MYISKVIIKNFRGFNKEGVEFKFKQGINIILGENNIGKSSLIDALRLSLVAGQYKKGIYISIDDFNIDTMGKRADTINIDIYFEGLSQDQGTAFYLLTNGLDTTKAELHLQYNIYKDTKGNERVKDSVTGGPSNNSIDHNIFDNISTIFMPALRNVESDLKPSRNSQLASLMFSHASSAEDKERITKAFIAANDSVKQDQTIQELQKSINDNLHIIEKEELQQQISIDLIPPTFETIAGALDAWYIVKHRYIEIEKTDFQKLADSLSVNYDQYEKAIKETSSSKVIIDLEILEKLQEASGLFVELKKIQRTSNRSLRQNGLGYNNLLSMATTLSDMQKKPNDDELSVFLIEEPEAHLHPQLLELLFNFFKQTDKEEKIQIFLTSHSPSLIAKADIESLNILYRVDDEIQYASIGELPLEITDKEDLKRYLDVTKSQLLFAKRVVFVEGISEAMLMSEFANLLGKPFDKYSVETVNISGVAFGPFAKIFSPNVYGNHLKYKCAIISDDDRCTNDDDTYQITKEELKNSSIDTVSIDNKLKNGTPSYRAQKLNEYNNANITVKLAYKTLEYELASISDNVPLLLEVLESIHPTVCKNIRKKIEEGIQQSEVALYLWLAICGSKGVFAQRLATELRKIYTNERDDTRFIVPKYIKEAIDFII